MSKESLTPYSELDATLKDHAEILKEVLREPAIRRSVCPEPPAGTAVSRGSRPDEFPAWST
jgi:hypothetical protein